MRTHLTRWPITDQNMTFRELVTEAAEDLPGIVEESGAVIAGEPDWSIEPGDEPHLVATTPVTVIDDKIFEALEIPDPPRKRGPKPGAPISDKARAANRRNGRNLREAVLQRSRANREAIEQLLDEHPHLSQWEIGQALGLHVRTVQRHMAAMRTEHAA